MTTTPKEQAAAEALRLAKDAILHAYGCYPPPYKTDSVTVKSRKALEAIEEALATPSPAPSAEPVAWRWDHVNVATGEVISSGVSLSKVEPTDNTFWMASDDPRRTATRVTPLYTHPAPTSPAEPSKVEAVVQEALELGLDLARAELVQAKALYGDYPRDGLGRKLTAAERDVDLFESALHSIATHPKDEPWKQAIDDELVSMGMTADSYTTAKEAVKALIDWHVSVALDPAVSSAAQALVDSGKAEPAGVPQGWQLVPKEPTPEMRLAGKQTLKGAADFPEGEQARCVYEAMLSAAPAAPQGNPAECPHGVSDGACKQCYVAQDKEGV